MTADHAQTLADREAAAGALAANDGNRARPARPVARRRAIAGVEVSIVDYDQALDVIDEMIERRERGYVVVAAVHAVMVARRDEEMRRAMAAASLVVPDGMPLVWAANFLGEGLTGRVYGPELMRRHLARSARRGHRVWLYGGRDAEALRALERALVRDHPGLEIAGGWSPPFRPLTDTEEDELAERINRDRPEVLWVGIGQPKQEKWMARMRDRLDVPVMVGVGAAFDLHAGLTSQAPRWMQDRGLEWLYRLSREPRRLAPRYLRHNPAFLAALAGQLAREGRARGRREEAT